MKLRVVILGNELENDHHQWIIACESFKDEIDFRVINLTGNNWLEDIRSKHADILLAKPGGLTSSFKQLYDERIIILSYVLGYKIFPSPTEVLIYENKRFLSFWLAANNLAHPATSVFYDEEASVGFIDSALFPIVAKTNIGASGSGVHILKRPEHAIFYIKETFHGQGALQRSGPNFRSGNIIKRGIKYLMNPFAFLSKLKIYNIRSVNRQKGFVIFQEYIPHDFEWRVVRIGDSFFAHKKMKSGEKTSGSLVKKYDNPPLELMNYVKEITDKYQLYSQAIDLFESKRGFLINEMQCIFGQSDSFQMQVDGKEGRYVYKNTKWEFEPGPFAENACYNLRLRFILDNFKKSD